MTRAYQAKRGSGQLEAHPPITTSDDMFSRHTSIQTLRRSELRRQRGFTMVELLAVLAMIGILSALAIVGYRRYLDASRSGDAKAIIAAIRVAEENYRAETLSYLSCSGTLEDWYPATPNGNKRHFINPAHSDVTCWRMLNVVTDSPTRYGFAVVAGAAGTAMPAPSTVQKPTWPSPTTEPWFVVQAAGDNDGDGTLALFVSSSLNGEIYAELEEE